MRDERGLVNLENTHSLDKEDDARQWSSAYHQAHTGLAEAGHGREQVEDGRARGEDSTGKGRSSRLPSRPCSSSSSQMLSRRTFTALELDDKDALSKSQAPSMKDAGEAMFTMKMPGVLIFTKLCLEFWFLQNYHKTLDSMISAHRMSPFYTFSFSFLKFYF